VHERRKETHVSDARYTLLLSLWRTFIPYLVGFICAAAARWGLHLDEQSVEAGLVLVFGTVYYAASRWLEQNKGKRWGWLLGYAKQPLYRRGRHRAPVPMRELTERSETTEDA
jgi:hypothetical protein